MKKKILVFSLAAVLLVVAAVGGTLAYLTANDTVTNTFAVGKVKMVLNEANVGADGKEIAVGQEGAGRGDANKYKIVPGAVFDKDPMVTIEKGSEPCYVFVEIDDQLNVAVAESAEYTVSTDWKLVDGTTNVYQYKQVVDATAATNDVPLTPVFETVTINGNVVTEDNINDLNGKTIIVTAFAHQSGNVTEIEAITAAKTYFAG